jgi:protein-S-isoprenylcysteine O-methyltransferase Ste14
MAWFPSLSLGWLNGWLLLGIDLLVQGIPLLVFPKAMVTRLFDRAGWSPKQRAFTILGKVFSLICLGLIILTPLNFQPGTFIPGVVLYTVGLAALLVAMLDFRDTPPDQPVVKGLYRYSRHPQIVALFLIFLGMCLAIASWPALLALLVSRLLQHYSILAEEGVCLERYGEPYRTYMERVPRYFWIF